MKTTLLNFWTRLSPGWRFAVGGYFALRLVYLLWSAVVLTFYPLAVKTFDLFGQPVLTVFDLKTGFRAVYDPVVEGQRLTFVPIHNSGGQIGDLQTGSRWNVYDGSAVSGVFVGKNLSSSSYSVDKIFPYFGLRPFPNKWLSVWQRFDTNWYVSIADRGYGAVPDDIHFPPLFPLAIKLFELFLKDGFVAGMVVSSLATLLCLKLIYELFEDWGRNEQDGAAAKGFVYFLLFPASFFLFGAYTEGMFIVTAILALRSIRKAEWIYSGIWISCATLIRLQGVALLVPLMYCIWISRTKTSRLSALASLCLAVMGGLIYLALRNFIGSSAVMPLAETNLYAHLSFPWDNFMYAFRVLLTGGMGYIDILNLIVSLLFLALIIQGWKYIPLEYNLYLVATYIVLTARIVDTQPLNSMLRYVITLFPSFYVLGKWGRNSIIHRLILYPSVLLLLFLTAQFWVWGWVA